MSQFAGDFESEPEEPVLEGEVLEPAPRAGTLAWLEQQPHVEVEGRRIPAVHRLDVQNGGHILLGDDDGKCRYVKPTGERCRAPRTLAYGLCLIHSGGGVQDIAAMGRAGAAAQARLRVRRELLGRGAANGVDPRSLSRIRALERADDIASALLAPLDADDLGAMSRQRAATTILDALWPVQHVTVSVDMPADEAGVGAMGWQEMQQLAAQLLELGPGVEPDADSS